MTITDLKRLKKKLPKYWRKTIHESTGLSYSTIEKTANGKKYQNEEVIDAMISLAATYQEQERARKENRVRIINSL